MKCPFCNMDRSKYLAENEHFYAIRDSSPFTRGHCLVVSKRHAEDFFELRPEEMGSLLKISLQLRDILDSEYDPDGYNLLMNSGRAAGQSVFHFHLHFLPRHRKDGKFFGVLKRFVK